MSSDASELRRLASSLGAAGARTGPLAQAAMRKTLKDIEGTAKVKVPVDTANLKNSIGTSDLRTIGQSGNLSGEVGPTASYGLFVENGTSRMAPQPFMGPAADTHLPAFEQAVTQLGLDALDG